MARRPTNLKTLNTPEYLPFPEMVDSECPQYEDITSADSLRNSKKAFRRLQEQDWAFVDDSTAYLSHDLHPYPAKFIPQIPGTLIANLSLRGELVLDPFGGSGTTALEAIRLGRRAVSIDANPIASLIARVKTAYPSRDDLAELRTLATVLKTRLEALPSDARVLITEFGRFAPDIPNRPKWFPDTSYGELAMIKFYIGTLVSECARNIARLALSRIIVSVSFQDSETRYVSVPRGIPKGFATQRFLNTLNLITAKTLETAPDLQYGVASFVTRDFRRLDNETFPKNWADLIVTSPPYGNANDYHLYHRFRIFWLGFDPRRLARIEIGSHLRHQKEGTGFEEYLTDLQPCVAEMYRLLKPGRYAAIVLGYAIYQGQEYDIAEAFGAQAKRVGFRVVGCLSRPIHKTKRSFALPARRALNENILIVRKPSQKCFLQLSPPTYKMWPYERILRHREIERLLGAKPVRKKKVLELKCDWYNSINARRLVFSRSINFEGHQERTWQEMLENGCNGDTSRRKDPKYVTHGIHAYKGKFYPQLAKGLINIAGVREGATVLDPFCGSGTTILEAWLNGLRAFGCDLHPLAAKIAKAKVGILQISPNLLEDVVNILTDKISSAPQNFPNEMDQFPQCAFDEIRRWFAIPIALKVNWVLKTIRSLSSGIIQDFLEVILSDIIRAVSHQDPADLRIRRRKTILSDADVLAMFKERLDAQFGRLKLFWSVRGYCPYHFYSPSVSQGDSRELATFDHLRLKKREVDLILTSPPYATALPYIDTDRLSLLILFGLTASERRPLEHNLTGSREISQARKRKLEQEIEEAHSFSLPANLRRFIKNLYEVNSRCSVGFRRQNLPAVLLRYFKDIKQVMINCAARLKASGEAMLVIGNNYTIVEKRKQVIRTIDFVEAIGEEAGFESIERIPITVTTENLRHVKNAIRENTVLRIRLRSR